MLLSSVLLVPIFSFLAISNANRFIPTDCVSITTKTGCDEYPKICEWVMDILECKFLYQNNDIIGARKLDLVFVTDPGNIDDDLSLFVSSTTATLYDRYDNKQTVDLRCIIIPYQHRLVPCSQLLNIEFINNLLNYNQYIQENMNLLSNFDDAIDFLLETNTKNDRDRDQYIITNFNHRYNDNNLANNLCTKLKELSLFRIYPLLIQWKSAEYDTNFDTNCPFLQNQPQFIHKINKYDVNKSIPKISSIVASKIHRNSMNPARFTSINPYCVPFDLAAQAYCTRDAEIWYISGIVDIPTSKPTSDPTPGPTPVPTSDPTPSPTPSPTQDPTPAPTQDPTPQPTPNPTPAPTKWPTPSPTVWPTPWPTPRPTEWPTPWWWDHSKPDTESKYHNKNGHQRRRRLQEQDQCSGGSGSYSGWVACTSMETEQTTVVNAETADNTDQSVSNGYSTESLLSVFGSFDIYNITSGDILRNNIFMNNSGGCVIGDGNDEFFFQIGGYNIHSEYATFYLQIFDTMTMSWYGERLMPNMNVPRYLHSCILVNYTLYAFGGIQRVQDTNNPDTYYDSIEYFNFNPMMYSNMSIKQLLCLKEYDTDDCYIGGVSDPMYEPKWEIAYAHIHHPRISAKLLAVSDYKIFLIGGYGYHWEMWKNGALDSIEIYNTKTDEIMYDYYYGPRLITARAAFSAGIYDDEYGYKCLFFVGGKTGFHDYFINLPLLRSCEKMCFPSYHIENYMDNMFDLLYVDKNVINTNNNINITYNKWIISASIIIVLLLMFVVLFIKTKNQSKGDQQQGVNENTPLLI